MDTGGEGGMNWEFGMDGRALPCIKPLASGNLTYSARSSARCSGDLDGWDGGVGEEGGQEGGDICIHIADSLRCTAETNTTM